MARALISSASLAPEFRLDSLWFGIGHSSNFDDEVENALDEYVDAVFRGGRQISKKDFLFYMENVDEIKNLNHGIEKPRQLRKLMTRHQLFLLAFPDPSFQTHTARKLNQN